MQSHNWMVRNTPQTGWIRGKGAFVWLSLYAGVLGGGAYLASILFHNLWGMFISWLFIVLIKGGLHFTHAERPARLWRMILNPGSSWISRGLLITGLVVIFGAIQMAASYWLPGSVLETTFLVLTGIGSIAIMLYTGLALSDTAAIPLWNTASLPFQLVLWGGLGGLGFVLVMNTVTSGSDIKLILASNLALLLVTLLNLILFMWTAGFSQITAKESATNILRELVFWLAVKLIGIVIPICITGYFMLFGNLPTLFTGVYSSTL